MTDTAARIEVIRDYFRKVDARDPTLADLFTEDVVFFFPKYGEARGKAAVARFGARLGRHLASIGHDIDGLVFTAQGDRIAVEGREWGVTAAGQPWPDGIGSQGRFCNLFEFRGLLICRTAIYVDPDFASGDEATLRALRDDSPDDAPRAVVERYLQAVAAYYADPASPATLQAVVALFGDDLDWDIPGNTSRLPHIGPRRGKAGAAAFFRAVIAQIEPRRFDVRRIMAGGDTVVVLGDLASKVRLTGKTMQSTFAIDITVRDGLIRRYRLIEDSFAADQAFA